ncbi:MAG: efflux RND transporter periplasmic adaptor subunit, partial [Wenzhouxiangella sp.]
MSRRKKIVTALVVLVLLAALVAALRPSPIPVDVATAERGEFIEYVEDEGRTWLRDTYVVSAPIGGYLLRVALEPGDVVAAGDTVFVIEPSPAPGLDARTRQQAQENVAAARARLDSAIAERDSRQSEARLAKLEYERLSRLAERGAVSQSELERAQVAEERARLAARAAEASVTAARHELENARAVLEVAEGERSEGAERAVKVAAPVGGVVVKRERCCEGIVQAGESILEIGDLDELEIRVDLLSMDAVRVRPGMRVVIDRWGGNEPLEGRVRRVEPAGYM